MHKTKQPNTNKQNPQEQTTKPPRQQQTKNPTTHATTDPGCCYVGFLLVSHFPPVHLYLTPFLFNSYTLHLTEPRAVFSYILDFKPKKLLTVFNNPFVAVTRALFSLPNFYFLLHAHSQVCYCKVAHWDEGWAAGMDGGLAEKGLKYRVDFNFCNFSFKHTKISYKELANTLHGFVR